MCGCARHGNLLARCNCICPEHKNFELASTLASDRYNTIVELKARVEELEEYQSKIESTNEPQYGALKPGSFLIQVFGTLEQAQASARRFGKKVFVRATYPARTGDWAEYTGEV